MVLEVLLDVLEMLLEVLNLALLFSLYVVVFLKDVKVCVSLPVVLLTLAWLYEVFISSFLKRSSFERTLKRSSF